MIEAFDVPSDENNNIIYKGIHEDIFIDIDFSQIYRQKIGGDVFIKRNPERSQIVAVLSDG